MNNRDYSASPAIYKCIEGGHEHQTWRPGLTKREAAAIAAMQGLLADPTNTSMSSEKIASWAVRCADALFDALEAKPEGDDR